jgi:pimeloyl-ACP methyl ester carboxylesterase
MSPRCLPPTSPLTSRTTFKFTPPNLLHGVESDAADVASFLAQRTTGPVVLVGHSYGGVVITNAGAAGGDVKAFLKPATVHESFAQDLPEAALAAILAAVASIDA